MNWRLLILVVGAGWLATGCGNEAPPARPAASPAPASAPGLPTHAQGKLRTVKLWLGPEEMTAELAVSQEEVNTGMMFRTNIAENTGMLFVFGKPWQASFWMKNCPVPLSAAYIDPAGTILELREFHAQDTNPVVAVSHSVQYVLETRQGWFEEHHIRDGMLVRTEYGSFPQTFTAGSKP
jgi:hypothetical protein